MLPEISQRGKRDNSLFLWRLDVADDVPVEYSGEEQAIVAVGLVKPKTGVFLEAISYVLEAGDPRWSSAMVGRVPGGWRARVDTSSVAVLVSDGRDDHE